MTLQSYERSTKKCSCASAWKCVTLGLRCVVYHCLYVRKYRILWCSLSSCRQERAGRTVGHGQERRRVQGRDARQVSSDGAARTGVGCALGDTSFRTLRCLFAVFKIVCSKQMFEVGTSCECPDRICWTFVLFVFQGNREHLQSETMIPLSKKFSYV